jgi:hypothetical protein
MKILAAVLAALAAAPLSAQTQASQAGSGYHDIFAAGLVAYDLKHGVKVAAPASCAVMPRGRPFCWTTEEQATYWPCIYRAEDYNPSSITQMYYLSKDIETGWGGQSISDWYRAHNPPEMCADYLPAHPSKDTLFVAADHYMDYVRPPEPGYNVGPDAHITPDWAAQSAPASPRAGKSLKTASAAPPPADAEQPQAKAAAADDEGGPLPGDAQASVKPRDRDRESAGDRARRRN